MVAVYDNYFAATYQYFQIPFFKITVMFDLSIKFFPIKIYVHEMILFD